MSFIQVAQRTNSPLHGHVFNDPEDVDRYERTFHIEVLLPTMQMFENKTVSFTVVTRLWMVSYKACNMQVIDDKIWQQHPLLTDLR